MLREAHNRVRPGLRSNFAIDVRTLALFRIAIGSLLLVDLGRRLRHVEMLFTDAGLLTKQGIVEAYGPYIPWTSLHYYTGSAVWLQCLMLIIAVVPALGLLLGYRTRLATLLSWLLLVSLNARVPATCYGFDAVMRLMLIWSLFLPLGAKWSVDSRRRGTNGTPSFSCSSMASAGILLQVCFIYWFTGILKLHPDWLEGRAIQYAMQLDYAIRPLGQWLARQPRLTVPLTYATLLVEFVVPVLALCSPQKAWLRWFAILTMWALHLGIAMCLKIGLFPAISIVYWMLFIPPSTWDGLARRWGRALTDQPGGPMDPNQNALVGTSRVANVLATMLLVLITLYNVLGLPQVRQLGIRMPKVIATTAKILRVDQNWILFAPTPRVRDGWYIMPAILADGSTYDVWLNQPVTYGKPALVSSTFPSFRCMMFLMRGFQDSPRWPWVARYVIRKWNSYHPPELRIQRLQIIFIGEVEHDGDQYLTAMLEYDADLDRTVELSPSPIGKE